VLLNLFENALEATASLPEARSAEASSESARHRVVVRDRAHGGRVELDNRVDGPGCVARLTLPFEPRARGKRGGGFEESYGAGKSSVG
jgi:hypothetical protein